MKMEVSVSHDIHQLASFIFQFLRNFHCERATQRHDKCIRRFNSNRSLQRNGRHFALLFQRFRRVRRSESSQCHTQFGVTCFFELGQGYATTGIHLKRASHGRIENSRSVRKHDERNSHGIGYSLYLSHIPGIHKAGDQIDRVIFLIYCGFSKIGDHGFGHIGKASNVRALITRSVGMKYYFSFGDFRLFDDGRNIIANSF